jgi:hypothetical protein
MPLLSSQNRQSAGSVNAAMSGKAREPHLRLSPACSVYIHTPRMSFSAADSSTIVTASIEIGSKQADLWYRFQGVRAEPSANAFLPAVLLPAMMRGVQVVSEAPVSQRLLRQLSMIQDIYATWIPSLRKVPIVATGSASASEPGPEVATCFTGGIDSCYTLLTHRAEISTLLHVYGFDQHHGGETRMAIARMLRGTAQAFGKQLIEVDTNLAALLDDWLEVDTRGHLASRMYNFELAHGAALASVAQLLPRAIGRVYVPATYTYNDLIPWGSHPLLDPLWSTEERSVVHDGCTSTRVEKARVVAQSETAMHSLRVCSEGGVQGVPNCGRCEKCVRTMVNLRLAGAPDRCTAFAEPLDLRRVALLKGREFKPFLRENLAAARAQGSDPALVTALERAVNPWAPGRLRLELLLALWRLAKRVLPVTHIGGRIHWHRDHTGPGAAGSRRDSTSSVSPATAR